MRDWNREDRADSTRGDQIDRDAPLPGVIDTIGFGYAALALRPLAIVPIVLLELSLLFGPRVTLAPLTNTLADALRRRGENWDALADEVGRLEGFNIFEAGTLEFPLLRTPGIVPTFDGNRVEELRIGATWSELPGVVVMLILIGSLIAGLLLAACYRSLLAQATVTGGDSSYPLGPHRIARRATRLGGWMLAIAGLAMLIAMPVLVASIAGAALGFGNIPLLWLFLIFPVTWAWVHFYFSVHALVLDDLGPFESLRASYRVVQRHFWQSLRFMGVSLLITTGLSYALRVMATSLPGALLAIMLNAVIASGMIIAAMLFYRDRAKRLGLHAEYSGR